MTRTNRRRFLVLFAAIAALLALSGALALPETAQAQSAGVLVSNIGQTSDGTATINSGSLVAQGFKVASGGGNYTLTSIEVPVDLFGISALTTADLALLSARLWSADAFGEPVSSLHQLTNPPSISDGDTATFTAPSGSTLQEGNTYAIVLTYGKDIGEFRVLAVAGSGEDTESLSGWSIRNSRHWREDTATLWKTDSSSLQIRVNGTAAGEAPTLSTDATLSELVVNDGSSDLTLTPTFVSGMYAYAASVGSTVDEVTVTPTKNDSGATIVWLDGSDMTLTDADTADGQQVTLVEGDNVIKVKVTAEDGTATQTYTVTVNRPAAEMTPACTLNTGDLWCGVATVGTDSNGVGFVGNLDGLTDEVDAVTGALTNNSGDQKITIGSDIYTVTGLTILASPLGTLALRLTRSFPDSDAATLEFHIGAKTFKVSEANHFTSPYIVYTWADSGLSWSDDDMVTLRLRRAAAANVAPAFTSAETFGVAENGTTVGTVEASDDDMDDEITGYALTGGADQALFSIGSTSGALTFQAAPNYEDPQDADTDNAYEVTVQATGGTGSRVLTAVSGATDSLAVTWSEPDLNGGPAITGYGVEYRVGATGTWTDWSHSGTDATTTITGLTADTDYQVQVRALNGETPSDWSDPSDAVRTNAETTPVVTIAKDKNVVLEEEGTADFTLSRTGSTTAALTVTVEVTQEADRDILPDGAAAERTVTFAVGSATTALMVTLDDDDLKETNGELTVEVQAGAGYTVGDPASATVTVGDRDTGRPTPANLMASPGAGAGEVVLSWDAHAPQLVFTRHQYRYKTDGDYLDAWADIPNSGQNASFEGDGSNLTGYTVTGLVGGQVHSFQVRTYSLNGGNTSAASNEAMATPRSAVVSFGAGSYSVDEGGDVEVTVQLDAAPGREVVVPVSAAGAGGATAPGETGADWSGVPENVTFGATDTAMTFTLAATQDTDADAGESVALSFGTLPDGVTAGSPSEATVTITDDDTAASTCTLNTGDLWCGVVTVALYTAGGVDLGYGFVDAATDTGALSDTGFNVGPNSYTIDDVWTGVGSLAGALNFGLTSILTAPDQAKLVLHVDSTSFAFSAATGPDSPQAYRWLTPGLDWSSESSVTLRLRALPDAPTNFTAKVGDTQVALAWKAAALDSGVTGHEYRYKTDGDYPLTWTAIANSGPDEANEDSFTVTGLTNEEAHTFELRAVNTAGGGDAATAGPVTPTPGICDRTQKIQDVILAEISGVDDCAAVTVANLAAITQFGFFGSGTVNQGITSLQAGDFAGLTSLTILNLALNSLTSLPEGIFDDLAELTELNLASNDLESLPEGVFDGLVKLATLSLTGNSLTELRAGAFANLTALSKLELDGNALTSLPEELFSDLTALLTLALSGNDLDSLPEELFSGLTALAWLDLKDNDLDSLPEELFSGLTSLDQLFLDDNDLDSLPEGLFSGLTALTNLELDDNALDSLPGGLFSGLTALTKLHLENNALNALPDGVFSGLTALTHLTLEGNSTDPMELTVTVEKVGTNQVRAKVLAGAPFAVEFSVTPVNGTLEGSVTVLGVAVGAVEGSPVTMTRTDGTTAAVTVDVDLSTQPTLPMALGFPTHKGYIFKKATTNLPATILPDATNAAPAFTSSTTFNPAENQTTVGTVEASDDDMDDDITGYALNGGADQALFSINDSGVLTFQAAPNYEDPQDANTDNAYVVVVRATSGTGARVKAADQTITVTVMNADEQTDTPAKPTVTAVEGSTTSLTATWVKPGLNGGPDITSYDVEYREGMSGTWTFGMRTTGEVTATIDGLTANTEHQVRVRALNGETPSDWSDPSEAVSTNSAADNAPVFSETAPRRAVPENSAAGVDVGAPVTATPADSGDTLEYTLEGRDASSFDIVFTSGQIRTKSGVTYDYEDQSSYAVTVKASDGTASATIAVTINLRDVAEQPDKPAKPTLEAVSGSTTRLVASWTEPGLNGGPAITGYEVDYREGMSGTWTFGVRTTEVTWRITRLTANTSYQVRVQALNGDTPSAWSDPSDAVRTNAEADPPTVASVAVKSAPQPGDAYGWGETIVFTLTFTQKVRVTGHPQPTLAFNLGGSTREARYAGMSDTDVDSDPRPRPRPEGVKVHFYYTVQSGEQDSNGIEVGERGIPQSNLLYLASVAFYHHSTTGAGL